MSKIRLGIADDNEEFCAILLDYLIDQGNMDVAFIVNDGLAAVEAVKKYQPDVLLLDIIMPHLDGLGVLETINAMDLPALPKTIVLSAFNQEVITQKAVRLGADYYVTKPFNLSVLSRRINQLAGKESEDSGRVAAASQNRFSIYGNLEMDVTEILCELAIPAHIKGYQYLRDSIIMTFYNPEMISAVTKELYPAVAKMNKTLPGRVERNIRHAINVAWTRADEKAIDTLFGHAAHERSRKPANSEFIAAIADKLRLERKLS